VIAESQPSHLQDSTIDALPRRRRLASFVPRATRHRPFPWLLMTARRAATFGRFYF
jgi:hypothetical protein